MVRIASDRRIRQARDVSQRPPLPRNVWILGFVSLLMDLSSEIYHALLPAFITLGPRASGDGARRDRRNRRGHRQFRQADVRPLFGPEPEAQAVDRRRLWPRRAVEAAVPARGERARADGRPLRRPHRQGHSRRPARRDGRRRDAARNPRPRLRPEAGAGHRRRAARADRRHRPHGVVRERHPRWSIGSRSSPPLARSCSRGWRCGSRRAISPAQARAVLRGFQGARPGHQATARGRLPVHAGALFRGVPDPQGDRDRAQRSAVAADPGVVQPGLCRARLSRGRAERPDEPANHPDGRHGAR